MNNFFAIESELNKRREQAASVRSEDTPFRVEFRYRGGTKHWQYFTSLSDAAKAEDAYCGYTPMGRGYVESPSSQRIQIRGPRGGWSNWKG